MKLKKIFFILFSIFLGSKCCSSTTQNSATKEFSYHFKKACHQFPGAAKETASSCMRKIGELNHEFKSKHPGFHARFPCYIAGIIFSYNVIKNIQKEEEKKFRFSLPNFSPSKKNGSPLTEEEQFILEQKIRNNSAYRWAGLGLILSVLALEIEICLSFPTYEN